MTSPIIARRRVFSGKVVFIDEIDLNFGPQKTPTYELISFSTLTGVSALPVQANHIYLLKHYQLGRDQAGFSLPSGGLAANEDPADRMNQELMEELGMRAKRLTLMLRPDILPGYIGDQPGYLYLAQDLVPATQPGDEEYPIKVVSFSLNLALSLIKQGKITDARTCLAILIYHQWYG